MDKWSSEAACGDWPAAGSPSWLVGCGGGSSGAAADIGGGTAEPAPSTVAEAVSPSASDTSAHALDGEDVGVPDRRGKITWLGDGARRRGETPAEVLSPAADARA